MTYGTFRPFGTILSVFFLSFLSSCGSEEIQRSGSGMKPARQASAADSQQSLSIERQRGPAEQAEPVKDQPQVAAPTPGKVVLDVPYYYQLHNKYEPRVTCNITSVAMALGTVGKTVTPDQIYQFNGRPVFTGPEMVRLARHFGAKGSEFRITGIAEIKRNLDKGYPVILQGWFTPGSGHIILLVGYDDKGFITHDSFGKWDGRRAGTYVNTPTAGKYVNYSYDSILKAATNGDPNDLYVTIVKN